MALRLTLFLLLCAGITQAQVVPYPINQFTPPTATFPVTSTQNYTLQATSGTLANAFNGALILQGTANGGGGGGEAQFAPYSHTSGGAMLVSGNTAGTGRSSNVYIVSGSNTNATSGESGWVLISTGTCLSTNSTACNIGEINIQTTNVPTTGNTNTGLQHGINFKVGSENTGATGGPITFTAGSNGTAASCSSNCPGGNLNFNGGASSNGQGGSIIFVPGTGTTTGGTIQLQGLTTGTNADFLCVDSSGDVLIQSSACTISSQRFKTAVIPLATALGEIDRLEVATFSMKAHNKDPNGNVEQIGLIAEDVARVEPRCAVYENDMRTPKSYRQECVIAMLVKAVQEQQQEIKRLQRH